MSVTSPTPVEITSAVEIVMRENATDAGAAAQVMQSCAEVNGVSFIELANEIVRIERQQTGD